MSEWKVVDVCPRCANTHRCPIDCGLDDTLREGLPDALLTPQDIHDNAAWAEEFPHTDCLLESTTAANLNDLLAPLVSARVAAALSRAAEDAGDAALDFVANLPDGDTLDTDILNDYVREQVERLISAPAQAALDAVMAQAVRKARLDALEQAAEEASRILLLEPRNGYPSFQPSQRSWWQLEVARKIRALKEKP